MNTDLINALRKVASELESNTVEHPPLVRYADDNANRETYIEQGGIKPGTEFLLLGDLGGDHVLLAQESAEGGLILTTVMASVLRDNQGETLFDSNILKSVPQLIPDDAVLPLAVELQQEQPKAVEPEQPKEQPKQEATVTLNDLREEITARMKADKANKATLVAILGEFGAKRVTDVKEEDYSSVMAKVKEV